MIEESSSEEFVLSGVCGQPSVYRTAAALVAAGVLEAEPVRWAIAEASDNPSRKNRLLARLRLRMLIIGATASVLSVTGSSSLSQQTTR